MDIPKVAIKIYEHIYAERNNLYSRFEAQRIYREREKYGFPDVKVEEIGAALSWLKHRLVIDDSARAMMFTITDTGKKTPPEYLTWKEQEEYYDELLEKMKERGAWALGARVCLLLLFGGLFAAVFWNSLTGTRWPYWGDYLFPVSLFVVLLFTAMFGRKSAALFPAEDDLVFVKLWEAYKSLKSYELEKGEEDKEECVRLLGDAVKILGEDRVSSNWVVQDTIFGAFDKLAIYIENAMIPSLKEGKAEKVSSHIVEIGALFLERDVPGLMGFVDSLGAGLASASPRVDTRVVALFRIIMSRRWVATILVSVLPIHLAAYWVRLAVLGKAFVLNSYVEETFPVQHFMVAGVLLALYAACRHKSE